MLRNQTPLRSEDKPVSVFLNEISPTHGKYQATLKDRDLKKPKKRTNNPPPLFTKISWGAWSLLTRACVASSTTSPQLLRTQSPLPGRGSLCCFWAVPTQRRLSGDGQSRPVARRAPAVKHISRRCPDPFSPLSLLGWRQGSHSPCSLDTSPSCTTPSRLSTHLQLQCRTSGI